MLVADDAGLAALARPAAVAIHDDGNVPGQALWRFDGRLAHAGVPSLLRYCAYRIRVAVAIGADADHPDGGTDELLQAQDVLPRIGRQILEAADAGEVFLPAGHGLVDGLDVGEHAHVGTEALDGLAVHL